VAGGQYSGLVSDAWVILVDLLARFTLLLDDCVPFAGGDDGLDLRELVAGLNHEAKAVGGNRFVFPGCQLNRGHTGCVAALTVKGHPPLDAVLLGPLLDQAIHVTKHFLVSRRALGEIHIHDPLMYNAGFLKEREALAT